MRCLVLVLAAWGAPLDTSREAQYWDGTSLGGWLVMESWLYPNVPLMQAVPPGQSAVEGCQEGEYIDRMRARGIDAVASMHELWNTYVVDDLLGEAASGDRWPIGTEPIAPRLAALRDAGIKHLRIPVGWWITEAPVNGTDGMPVQNATNLDPGFTRDGFVSGGLVYLEAMLKLLKPLGMTAYLDMHALPGGAVKGMGYTGRFFAEAHFFDGAEAWLADPDPEALPAAPLLRQGVTSLRTLAEWMAARERDPRTAGVLTAMAPWNEALLGDNDKTPALQAFTLKVVPQLRHRVPGLVVVLNWFNMDHGFWAGWTAAHTRELEPLVVDVHLYHAFDANSYAPGCPQCTSGPVALENLLCKQCGMDDDGTIGQYVRHGLPVVVGEWSVANCNMFGVHPDLITDPDFLYTWWAAAKSAYRGGGAAGDFFWTGLVRNGGYDPTQYAATGPGSFAAVQALLASYALDPTWQGGAQVGAQPVLQPAPADYLQQWSALQLSATPTSDGHAALIPVGDGLQVAGVCDFQPAPRWDMKRAVADARYSCNPDTTCAVSPGAPDDLVWGQIRHVCTETSVDCAPIPGGGHSRPDDLHRWAGWAFEEFYHQNRGNQSLHGIVCFLDGAAYLPQCAAPAAALSVIV